MKKFILFSFIIITINELLKAQAYKPLIEDNKFWDVEQFVSFDSNPACGWGGGGRYFLNGDTVINGKLYKKVYSKGFKGDYVGGSLYCPPYLVDTVSYFENRFIREDTAQRKVYYYDPHINDSIYSQYLNCIIDGELLLYDFNYLPGDTVKCITATFNDCNFGSIVNSVSYFNIYGINRKVISFSFLSEPDIYSMIEGIGGSYKGGLFQTMLIGPDHNYNTLNCVSKNDSVLWGGSCADYITDINANLYNSKDWYFFPNPSNSRISFNKIINEKIQILNIYGEPVLINKRNNEINQIDISQLPEGTYIIKIGNTYKKLIKI